jgi:hypothetical protein
MSSRREFRTLDRVALSQRTRPAVPAPTTVEQFMAALFRGIDEGPYAQRGGHR